MAKALQNAGSSGGKKQNSNSFFDKIANAGKNMMNQAQATGSAINKAVNNAKPVRQPSSGGSSYRGSSSGSSGGSSGSGGYSTGYSQPNYYSQIMSYLQRQQAQARNSAIAALQANLNTSLAGYDQQLAGLGDEYQKLRNQSEVERYKSRHSIREALANRGQLDSGFGRQETLNLDTQYSNAINNINMQEAKAREAIELEKQRIQAEYQNQIAMLDAQLNSSMMGMLGNLSSLF